MVPFRRHALSRSAYLAFAALVLASIICPSASASAILTNLPQLSSGEYYHYSFTDTANIDRSHLIYISANSNSRNTQYVAHNGQNEPEWNSPDGWTAKATMALALATFILACATIALVYVTRGMWIATRDLGEDSKNATLAAAQNAKATGDLVAATKSQIDILRQEFVSTHRPRIIVRNVRRVSVMAQLPIKLGFYVMNIGDTEAIIRSIDAIVILQFSKFAIPRDLRLLPCDANKTQLSSGEFIVIESQSGGPTTNDNIDNIKNGGLSIRIVGCIYYVDSNNFERRTGFARQYSVNTGRFEKIDDDEYEYEY